MPEWKRVKIEDVCTIEKGITGLAKATPGKYPLVTTGADRKTSTDYQFDAKAVCIPLVSSTGHGKRSLNYVHYQEGKFALGSILAAVIPKDEKVLNARYLHVFLQKNKDRLIVPLMKGAANVSLSVKAISGIEIPLPSLERQEKALQKLDSISDEHEDFLRETDIQTGLFDKLRQAVLQEAIEGKLTKDWRARNPDLISGANHASKLLEKIKIEKERLIKEGDIRGAREISNSTTIRNLDIPNQWVWAKGEELFFVTKLAGFEYTKYIRLKESGDIPVIRAQNVRPLHVNKGSLLFIDRETSKNLERSALTKECLLVTFIGAGIGDVATFCEKERWHLAPNVAKMEPYGNRSYLDLRYLNYFLMSTTGQQEIFKHVKATAQPCLSMGTIRDIDYPVPSFYEQQAIVERVNKIMDMLDDLEKQIAERKGQSELLMRSVLSEAFTC